MNAQERARMPGIRVFSYSLFSVEKRIFRVGKKAYIVYADIRCSYLRRKPKMKSCQDTEEIRWQVVKAMLDDFPVLRKKVKSYIKRVEN
jgi:hypothetical protein